MVNAFWLDRDLSQAAAWLVDAHVTSSVFECSMVLTTAVQIRGYDPDDPGDGKTGDGEVGADGADDLPFTHADNPLTQWAGASFENWQYLRDYATAAHEEWRYRWDHADDESHGSWTAVESLDLEAVRALDWPSTGRNDPPQLTGDWTASDYVDTYRYYYANEKRHLFTWAKDREKPPWIDEYTVDSHGDSA